MNAKEMMAFEYIGYSSCIFQIPPYQRTYHWDVNDIKKLIRDVEKYIIEKEDQTKTYYLGSLITKRNKKDNIILVDGQQRVTTLILIGKILHSLISKKDTDKKFETIKLELRKIYQVETDEISKIKLNNLNNNHILEKILNDTPLEKNDENSNFYKNYLFLKKYFSKMSLEELIKYYKAFQRVSFACILLTDEDEHLVFESINSKGKKLLQSDLIKNYIFFICGDKNIFNYYNNVFLTYFADYKEELEFYRLYDSCKRTKAPESAKNGNKIYESFKEIYVDQNNEPKFDLSDLEDLKKFLSIYDFIKKLNISEATNYIINSSFSTYFPWIYNVLIYSKQEQLITFDKSDENKYVCDFLNKEAKNWFSENMKLIATYDLSRIFSGFGRAEPAKNIPLIERDIRNYFENKNINYHEISIRQKYEFFTQPDNIQAYRIPKDLSSNILNRDIYGESARVKCIFWIIENSLRKTDFIEWNDFKKLTIEHVLPQQANKNPKWISYYGSENELNLILQNRLNVIGNLTILGKEVNSYESYKSFLEKQEDFKNSSFKINNVIATNFTEWKKENIDKRSEKIFDFLKEKLILDIF